MTALLLDSAAIDDAARAAELGFVRGITTNPTLLRPHTTDPLRHCRELLAAANPPELFYQPTGAYGPWDREAAQAWELDPHRVVVKVPATGAGAALAAALIGRGARVAFTAVQAPHAMLVAQSLGCVAVIPYLDRGLRDPRVDTELLRRLAELRRGPTRIVAASVKNTAQVLSAFRDGADAVTAPLPVLEALLSHPAALEAEAAFAREFQRDP